MLLEYKGDKLDVNLIDEGQGEAIVLLHGWGARADLYRTVINPLLSDYRVVAPDLPGFGKTSEPSFAYSIEDYAGFVAALLKELGISKVHLIGHSHGGRTALELATGDYGFDIEKMVLLDSAGIPVKKKLSKRIRIRTYKMLKGIVTFAPVKKAFPSALDRLKKKFGSADYAAASDIMRQSMVKVLPCDYTDKLSLIKNSTLLIWGENDNDTPISCAKVLEKGIRDCGLVTIPKAGHFSFVEAPALTSNVLKSFFNIK
ncbi:MAG: alpha/beta hydrolase [Clostridia bacterium]|nr:alpha/beta hydrolase [Clostridia bacterium]